MGWVGEVERHHQIFIDTHITLTSVKKWIHGVQDMLTQITPHCHAECFNLKGCAIQHMQKALWPSLVLPWHIQLNVPCGRCPSFTQKEYPYLYRHKEREESSHADFVTPFKFIAI